MPFRAEDLRQRFATSIARGRLGHSYLLTGDHSEALENLAISLSAQVLGTAPSAHPDFHAVRPQSKSRQITVLQIRELERELYLRPYSAPLKVAVVFDAERMCLGAAAAANAFLKTLEEPPAHTLILLTSSRPALLLPTIRSRCLRLDLGLDDIDAPDAPDPAWIVRWQAVHAAPGLRAYARAAILHEVWGDLRASAEKHLRDLPEMEEDESKAVVEAEFVLTRQESLALLQRWYWRRSTAPELERVRAIRALENLQAGLAQNIEPNLATEVACLRMEGLV